MFKRSSCKPIFWFVSLSIIAASNAYAVPPDSGLDAQYSFTSDFSMVYFSICGDLPRTEGCYGSGSFGPFGHVGAMLAGNPTATGEVANRGVYVVDTGAGDAGNDVVLYHYVITNTITDGVDDKVTTTLGYKLRLPLTGGKNVRCSIAANAKVVVIGTDISTQVVVLNKATLNTQVFNAASPPTFTSITADAYGYISVSFGGTGEFSNYFVIGPSGSYAQTGGGQAFLLSTMTGLSTQDIVPAGEASTQSSVAPRSVASRSAPKSAP